MSAQMHARRHVLLLLGLMLVASSATAQTRTTLANIPQQNRSAGTYISPQVALAATDSYPNDYEVLLAPSINATDLLNPAKSFQYGLYWLDRGVWRLLSGGPWYGGPNSEVPAFSISITQLRGKTLRFEFSLPSALRIGAKLDIGPPLF